MAVRALRCDLPASLEWRFGLKGGQLAFVVALCRACRIRFHLKHGAEEVPLHMVMDNI